MCENSRCVVDGRSEMSQARIGATVSVTFDESVGWARSNILMGQRATLPAVRSPAPDQELLEI